MRLKTHILFPFFLIFITLVLALLNYTPGTYLTGWDTLHPEFNFPLNFSRLFFGVWRTDQGLGALAGHSHMADLPRVFLLWVSHFVLPQSFLRYSYIFFCLILGPLGFYFLIKQLFLESRIKNLVSFLSSLFYLFNLSTLQQFYVPFEMFPTQWAFLPWIILYTLKFLIKPSRRHLLLFSVFTLFAAPQAYAAHLWYPFFGCYSLFLILITISKGIKIKLAAILLVFTLFLNSFWLLPNLFYVATSASIPKNSQTNRLHSQEFLIRNRETGNIRDTALVKGFYFNWDIYDFSHLQSTNLMGPWNSHLQNQDVLLIGNLIFICSLLGLGLTIYQKKSFLLSFSPFFLIPLVLLLNDTRPFSYLFEFLLGISPLQEILRFVFTKISIVYAFGLYLYFANFLHFLFSQIHSKKTILVSSFLLLVSLSIYCYPMFQGYLISPQARVSIPNKYQHLWNFMSTLPADRILTLPLNEPTGWQYYQWEYQGSGFIWFGLPQSIFDRDSDRWQSKNQQAYRDFFYSVYGENPSNFYQNLQKYQVKYILWDQSVIPTSPKNQEQISFKYETSQLLNSLLSQSLIRPIFNDQGLLVYQIDQPTSFLLTQPDFNNSDGINNLISPTNRLDLKKISLFPQSDGNWNLKYQRLNYQLSPLSLDPLIKNYYSYNTTQGSNLNLDDLPHSQGLIIGFKSRFENGIPLRFCLKNSLSGICTFEDELSRFDTPQWDFFIVPPQDSSTGYDFQLNAISFANFSSRTQVTDAIFLPLPDSFFSDLKDLHPSITTNPLPSKTIFPNLSLVSTKLASSHDNYLVFNQAYNPYWLAFYFDGLRPVFLSGHTMVNNWSNGWLIPPSLQNQESSVYLLFWPQFLEFLGLFLIPISFTFVLKKRIP